jgi:hypothetical protein
MSSNPELEEVCLIDAMVGISEDGVCYLEVINFGDLNREMIKENLNRMFFLLSPSLKFSNRAVNRATSPLSADAQRCMDARISDAWARRKNDLKNECRGV